MKPTRRYLKVALCVSFLNFSNNCYLKTEGTDFSLMSWFSLVGVKLHPGQIFPSSNSCPMLLGMAAGTRTFDPGKLPQFHSCKAGFQSCCFPMKPDRNAPQ